MRSFILPGNNEKKHLLKVTYIGYQPLTLPCQPENDIHLQPDAQMLKEVTVTASRPLMERKNGAFVANVAGTPLSMLGSASDMIGHLPFVTGSIPLSDEVNRRSTSMAEKYATPPN